MYRSFACGRARVALAWIALAGLAACGGGDEGTSEEAIRHNNLGAAFLSQQKWDEALAEFRAGLAVAGDDPVLLNNVAVALLQQGEYEQAERSLRDALAKDPDLPYAHYNVGLIERNNGNLEQAAEHFARVAAHDSRDVFVLYNLGSTLAQLDRSEEAERNLRGALELNPTHVSTLYALGRLLVQTDRVEEGLQLIQRSQEIRARWGFDDTVGFQYGEQGPYAMAAEYPAGGLQAPEPVQITWKTRWLGERPAETLAWTVRRDTRDTTPVLLATCAGEAGAATLRPVAPHAGPAVLDPGAGVEIAAMTSGDLNGDGTVELVALVTERRDTAVSRSVRVAGPDDRSGLAWTSRPLMELPADARLESTRADVLLVDRDHDGDLDLLACWPGGCVLATNDGSGSFAPDPDGHGVGVGDEPLGGGSLAFVDYDNDRDVDLLVATAQKVHLYSNNRDGSFTDVADRSGLAAGGGWPLAVADLNKDGWSDLVLGTGPVRIAWNRRGIFEVGGSLPLPEATGSADRKPPGPKRVLVLDYDNDGFLDLATSDAEAGLLIYRNLGAEQWALVRSGEPLAALAALDVDDDGDLDLAVDGEQGFGILVNEGGNANNSMTIEPEGVNDNVFGIGARVEVLAGALRQGFTVVSPLALHVGLGRRESVDAVRIVWPNGVLQDEIDQEVERVVEIRQLDRKGTSCPLLYAHRDGGWSFVTDFLGGCAVGYQLAPGRFSVPDTDEYVRIEGGLTERDGELRIRLNNQLQEVIWFDQAQLVVVDHPQGSEVYPDERLMPGPPFPGFRLFASSDVRPIAAAVDPDRGDVSDLLRERDRRYVDGFRLEPFKGYAKMHALEIDLGDVPVGGRLALLLDGWIDYADSTANVAAAQAGLSLVPPRLHVADGANGWRATEGRMGFPAGLPKTMLVDLTGEIAASDARVRIETNMRIYWDRARVLVGGEELPLRVERLGASRAELRFGGFPREWSPDGRAPFGYDPNDVDPEGGWKVHAGAYTAFGDVTELLREIDDRLVTTRSGDEIELAFEAPAAPAPGFTRTYLLYADGFGKDMDANSAANQRVGPIPFHGMPVYPYGEEITPPVVEVHERPPRIVAPFEEGLPGAPPLLLSNGTPQSRIEKARVK